MLVDLTETEIFAATTKFYVRLRRVTGRVVDVLYMVENQQYAKYLIDYAKSINDDELQHHVDNVSALMNMKSELIEMEQSKEPIPVRIESERILFLE